MNVEEVNTVMRGPKIEMIIKQKVPVRTFYTPKMLVAPGVPENASLFIGMLKYMKTKERTSVIAIMPSVYLEKPRMSKFSIELQSLMDSKMIALFVVWEGCKPRILGHEEVQAYLLACSAPVGAPVQG